MKTDVQFRKKKKKTGKGCNIIRETWKLVKVVLRSEETTDPKAEAKQCFHI